MAVRDRIDPDARAALDAFLDLVGPGGLNGIADIPARREKFTEVLTGLAATLPPVEGVESADRWIAGPPTPAGAPDVPVRIYRPSEGDGARPGLLFIHGGGMVVGNLETEDLVARILTKDLGCVTVSVDYRLAPEHPDPAPVEDCYAALAWMAGAAGELGIDPERLAVYGGSAGGGLAAGTALMARDRGGPALAFQMLIYPMIDDRDRTPSVHEFTDIGIWDRDANLEGWRCLLGDRVGGDDVSIYAAPARATDLAGLPPAYIDVGELDLFRDEDIDYAARLLRAGVPTELHVFPGAYHAAELQAVGSALANRVLGWRLDALRRALGVPAPAAVA
ncbi:alpha/beta hydrolase [Capillimicrobium parvum]|uniref:Acetyl esterase n=1 Tax=Capillimicrobium parvum TaxID=2884022 RepID=A0A9E6Y0D3_9ACTN|nr:alpha/beta hydrolase [Capillimicrobium parvum]UGS37779.1 Acetyl esterase [Capillimicrobium parvum]